MFHELLALVPDAIILSDATGHISMANAQAEKLFGYSCGELIGKPVEVLIPHRLRINHDRYRKSYESQSRARPMGAGADLYCLRKDGSEFPGDISLGPLNTEQGSMVMAVVRDMTIRRQMEAKSREAERYARSLIEASLDPLATISVDGRITDVNQATVEVTGVSREQLIGSDFAGWFTEPEKAREGYQYAFVAGGIRDWPLSMLHVSGRTVDVLYNVSVYLDETGHVQGVFAAARDITERKNLEQQLTYQATHDALTGLPNRVLLQDRLQQAVTQSRRNGQSVAVIFMDIDNFKQVNDTLGHAIGDALLRLVAERVRCGLREGDTVARFGGDEFVILLQCGTNIHDLDGVALKLLDIISKPYDIEGHRLYTNASIGITVSPLDGDDAETLLRNADTAMYVAKEAGRNGYRFFSVEMDAGLHEKLEIENLLRQALENEELELYYQPKANLKSGEVVGVEALVRWHHPRHGLISPSRFIPIAEKCGLITNIGLWVLNEACRQTRQWLDEGLNPVRVAVNLSAGQCRSDEVPAQIKGALSRYRLEGSLIEVEITESMVMNDTESAICTFWELREMGVHVAMDDFGTGYSSLSYLKRFPIECIKIDKSFIDDMEEDLNDREIVCAIIAMAHSLGLRVIAEGVENSAQLSLLFRSGCDEIQGYHFSKPLNAEALTPFLREGRRLMIDEGVI